MKDKTKILIGSRVTIKRGIITKDSVTGRVVCSCKSYYGVAFDNYKHGHDCCGNCNPSNGYCISIGRITEITNLPNTDFNEIREEDKW